MRRADRNAKTFSPSATMKWVAVANENHGEPGRGEIVGGELSKHADEFAKLARQKGGVDHIQLKLAGLLGVARHDGRKGAEDHMLGIVRQNQEIATEKVVCGFIAEFDALSARGNISPIVMVSRHTIASIVDALACAGYTAHGKN